MEDNELAVERAERVIRIASGVISIAIGLAVLDQTMDGELRRQAIRQWERLCRWWDRRSRLRMILDAFESGRATIEEAYRWAKNKK